jgi:hypothetical protein
VARDHATEGVDAKFVLDPGVSDLDPVLRLAPLVLQFELGDRAPPLAARAIALAWSAVMMAGTLADAVGVLVDGAGSLVTGIAEGVSSPACEATEVRPSKEAWVADAVSADAVIVTVTNAPVTSAMTACLFMKTLRLCG